MKMKRLLTGAMACVMAVGMVVPSAMAAEFNCEVKGTYVDGGVTDEVISYSYSSLNSISFNYSGTNKGTWNPETHEYEGGSAEGGWVANGSNSTTIKNHSNVAIDVTPRWAAESGFEGVDLLVGTSSDGSSDAKLDLPTAEGTSVEEAPSGTISFDIEGGSLSSGQTDVKIGTITLDVEKSVD